LENQERLTLALADRYELEGEIGSGGMATVYLARDIRHDRKVALKILRSELAASLGAERFLQEVRVTANLQHPHILPLFDSEEVDGFLYYVMPFVEGESLRERLNREHELPVSEAARLLRDVVDGLAAAHKLGVVHRDIKPENVLISGRHAMVADFGVAKAVSEATGRHKLTTLGVALGTPSYMAPEQAAADEAIDHRADIYAVGVMAYELLTGRPPFFTGTPQQILAAQVMESPQPVTKLRASVPLAFETIIMRCLEKKPADRWQSAEELLSQLEGLATPSGGVTPSDTRPVRAPGGRQRWLAPAALIAAAATVVIVAASQMLASGPLTITTSNIRPVTSQPGMEWQPALSPDGSQVAYVRHDSTHGRVVVRSTRDVAGAGLTLVPEGLTDQGFPAWSPDGEFVSFWGCGERGCTWREVGRLGGSTRIPEVPRALEEERGFLSSWSRDGSRVVYTAGDSIFVYSLTDGSSTLLALTEERWSAHSFAWSPDGNRIAYVTGNAAWVTYFNVAPSAIWMVDAGGGQPVRVTEDEYMDLSPAWLDDEHLLFISNRAGQRGVHLVGVGTKGPRGEVLRVPGPTDPYSISFSIAGKKLAYARLTQRQNIWSFPIGQETPVSIGDGHRVTDANQHIESHQISPDGRWIVYESDLRGNMDIYRRALDGGDPVRLTDDPRDEFFPKWSPDGIEIAFYARQGPVETVVKVMSADGGTPTELMDLPRGAYIPDWSPSGLDLAFLSGDLELWLISRDSVGAAWHDARKLTEFRCLGSDWALDGSGVLCAAESPTTGGVEFVLVSRDGEVLWRREPLTANVRTGILTGGGPPQFSRDGRWVFFWGVLENRFGIASIPVEGGEPRMVVVRDNPALRENGLFSVGPDNLYVTVAEQESDIWVMDVEVGR
jgi:serine/threonine-protein kinase